MPLPLTIFCLANVFYSPSLPSPTIAKLKHSQINRTRPYMAIPISRLLYQRINYLTIIERMSSGRAQYIAKCKEDGVKMGRPSSYRKSDDKMREQYAKEIALLKKGLSLRNVSAITGTSVTTIRKVRDKFITVAEAS